MSKHYELKRFNASRPGRRGMKREREFTTQIKHSILERGGFFYKIPDMPHFEGAKFRFDIPKPFDAIGVFAGQAFAIEAKVKTKYGAFGVKHLRPSQIEGLEAWTRAGGKAFVFLYIMQEGYGKDVNAVCRRLFVIPWPVLRDTVRFTRADLACMEFIPRQSIRVGRDGQRNIYHYRFNLDRFLISLVMDCTI